MKIRQKANLLLCYSLLRLICMVFRIVKSLLFVELAGSLCCRLSWAVIKFHHPWGFASKWLNSFVWCNGVVWCGVVWCGVGGATNYFVTPNSIMLINSLVTGDLISPFLSVICPLFTV